MCQPLNVALELERNYMLRVISSIGTRLQTRGMAALVLGAGLLAPASSQAGLTYDLRFSDGSSAKTVAAPGSLSLELWARVDGANGNIADEAMQVSYITLQSSGNVGYAGQLSAGATSLTFSGSGSRNGTAADLNSDGIGDWGSNSSNGNDTAYMLARSDVPVAGNTISADVNALDANTVEFRVGTWSLDITGVVGAASANIGITQPAFTTGGLQPPAYAIYEADGVSAGVTTGNTTGVYGDFVTITVPEPTSVLGLSLGAMMLLARRRKNA